MVSYSTIQQIFIEHYMWWAQTVLEALKVEKEIYGIVSSLENLYILIREHINISV